jgi:hypothetical protein
MVMVPVAKGAIPDPVVGIVMSVKPPLLLTTPFVAAYPMTAKPFELSSVPVELVWKLPSWVYNWLPPPLSKIKKPVPSIAASV